MHFVVQLGGSLDVSSLALDKQRVNDLSTSSVAMLSLRGLWSRKMERSRDMVLDVCPFQRRNHRLQNTHLDVQPSGSPMSHQ